MRNEDLNNITWHDGTTPISSSDILAKQQELVTTYNENRDLLMMGGYTQGQDQTLDQAITLWPKITEFIKQEETKKETFSSSSTQLMQVFGSG